jgi:hypothetical protein
MNAHCKTQIIRSWSTGAMLLATVIAVTACSSGGGGNGSTSLCDVPLEASLTSADRIGGATTSTVLFSQEELEGELMQEKEWTLYNVANELRARPVSAAAEDDYYHAIEVPGYIKDIAIVTNPTDGVRYALLAMGSEGIAVINLADPAAMQLVSSVQVNYYQDGITFTDGGGNIVPDNVIASNRAPISSLAIYDPPAAEAELQLLIGDEGFGLHKTLLSNLLGATGPVLEDDGTLLIDADDNDPTTDPITPNEVFTLQFAGEVPWGGPMSMKLYGAPDQRLFVAMGFLGMGIFDPDTLQQVGAYNLYTDTTVDEDWFIGMDVSQVVQNTNGDPFIDDFTGMMDYRQASFEISDVWHGDFDCSAYPLDHCTPWAAFDRYGKYYYMARAVDVATFDDGGQPKTIAYIAYGLAGLVAVNVTDYDTATPPIDPGTGDWGDYLKAAYLGYAPAVPANGPDTPTGTDAKSLFPHFGSGMLKEAGAIYVKVKLDGDDGVATTGQVYYSDHFAGLVVMEGAQDPAANWKDPSCDPDPCVNDDPSLGDGVLGDHWPDYEFVTSYDMSGADEHETPPAWMIDLAGPDLLVTGEVSGHGNALALSSVMNTGALGEIDVVLAAGAGGMNFLDIEDLDPATPSNESFDLPVYLATTDEIGADANGLPNQPISIGHTEGVDAWRQYLFVADGPHGASAWEIADGLCNPYSTDNVHLVANTLQDEYEVTNDNNIVVTPTPHAYDVVLDLDRQKALVLSQSLGLRQFGVEDVQDGLAVVGSPLLQQPIVNNMVTEDIFEHNVDSGNVVDYINRQDHAYDVVIRDTLAFVADGSNGLTVYDLTKVADYSVPTGDHVLSNLGAASGNPLLGRATAVKLWTDPNTGTEYAFVAAGHAGIAVVDITEVENTLKAPDERMVLVKRFEPKKPGDEDPDKFGAADGRSVDVQIVGDYAYFTYDSFGIVAYRIDDPDPTVYDLISTQELVDNNITDRTKIWKPGGQYVDFRPDAVARFKLQDETLGGWPELAGWGGGALGMTTLSVGDKLLIYVAYGDAGVIKINWTDPAAPVLEQHVNTVGAAADVTVVNGRAYVADNGGGIALIQ